MLFLNTIPGKHRIKAYVNPYNEKTITIYSTTYQLEATVLVLVAVEKVLHEQLGKAVLIQSKDQLAILLNPTFQLFPCFT